MLVFLAYFQPSVGLFSDSSAAMSVQIAFNVLEIVMENEEFILTSNDVFCKNHWNN